MNILKSNARNLQSSGRIIYFLASVCLTGCDRPRGEWKALEDIPIYMDADANISVTADGRKTSLFTIKKNSVCSIGSDWVYRKDGRDKAIKCPEGSGRFEGTEHELFRRKAD
jgi:hypothetical protein